MSIFEKAEAFKALHFRAGCTVVPNPWDAGSAVLLEGMGFEALATTSSGIAFSLAKRDGVNAVSRELALIQTKAIVDATSLPVSGDLEGGYGSRPEDCAETISQAAGIGLVGGSIEDATGLEEDPIYSLEEAAERVRAAAEAAHNLPFPFMLTARAENYGYGRPDLKDTIARLQAFQEAGADVLFAPGLVTAADIQAVITSVDRPVNVIMELDGTALNVAEIGALGAKRISVGSAFNCIAWSAFFNAAKEIKEHGRLPSSHTDLSFQAISKFFKG